MTEIFTVMVEPEWIYSVLERPHTKVQNHNKAAQWQPLILDFLYFFPSPVNFNHYIYQCFSGSFYLGENRTVIMMWWLKIEVYFKYSWTFDHRISSQKNLTISCFWDTSFYWRVFPQNAIIQITKIKQLNVILNNIFGCAACPILTYLQNDTVINRSYLLGKIKDRWYKLFKNTQASFMYLDYLGESARKCCCASVNR